MARGLMFHRRFGVREKCMDWLGGIRAAWLRQGRTAEAAVPTWVASLTRPA